MQADQDLFKKHDKARYGDSLSHQNIFLPKILRKDSGDFRLQDEHQENAHRIIIKWADLESKGKLRSKNETALEGEFLTEVFGEALGYTLFSKDAQTWNLSPKYSVNGGIADAAIGVFEPKHDNSPVAVIELKGPKNNLDRDRSNGRTAVHQCWDYLNVLPDCPWGIVCNYVSFRLYHREHSSRAYQLFTLQDLRAIEVFREFYYLFQKEGLIPESVSTLSRADSLLKRTGERQMEVGDDLYGSYDQNRRKMILHLSQPPLEKPLEDSIRIAQKLLDRIIFIAFCEDRGLLPENTIASAYNKVPPFARVTNPRWQNFLDLFHSVDKGNKNGGIPPFNGGLFRTDPEVDNLDLDDTWTNFFYNIGKYDFRDEVNVDVLGHLFEKSIRDIGIIKMGGLFDGDATEADKSKMTKSAERKRFGIYYTPAEFTRFITYNTIAKLIDERLASLADRAGIKLERYSVDKPSKKHASFWEDCVDEIASIKIIDPACGSGAFLIAAYNILEEQYLDVIDHLRFHDSQRADQLGAKVPDMILNMNLHGVDLSREAVELSQLALWIRSAQPDRALSDLSQNIVCGNSLVTDTAVHENAMEWHDTFPEVFDRDESGFDCIVGNPPWERLKLQEREFFDSVAPKIASAVNADARKKMINELQKSDPKLHERYLTKKSEAERTLDHVRNSDRFPLTGKGDINTYAVFAELAHTIVSPSGKVGLLVPSGIATDHTTRDFFGSLTENRSLIGLYDFENKAPVFPDVHRAFKFCILLFYGSGVQIEPSDYVFFAHEMKELSRRDRHIGLSTDDIKLLNPNTKTCPIFRSNRDAKITKRIYHRVPVLVDKNRKTGGNPWGIKFLRMLDQTNDAGLFKTAEWFKKNNYKLSGPNWAKGKQIYLPLLEAKMIQMYDHRAAGVVIKGDNWMRQGQTVATDLVQHQNPEFSTIPRWWVSEKEVQSAIGPDTQPAFLAYKDVTSATNQRTMISSFVPFAGTMNSAPLIITDASVSLPLKCCLLANLNSLAMDFVARQKVGGVHLNFFIVEQLPIFAPDSYQTLCPWDKKLLLEKWISTRVLKLTCTSNDMAPLAEAAGFEPTIHKWNPTDRANLMAELDAAYFHLYGIKREDVEYILSTFQGLATADKDMFGSGSMPQKILDHYDSLKEAANSK